MPRFGDFIIEQNKRFLLFFVERKTKETFVLLNNEVTESWYLPLVLLLI